MWPSFFGGQLPGRLFPLPGDWMALLADFTTLFLIMTLKALFNDVFTLKKIWAAWPYIPSVSVIRCKNEALKKIVLQSSKASLNASKEVKIDKWPDSPYSFPLIDCCVLWINGRHDSLFSGDIQISVIEYLNSDRIHFKTFVFLAVYWPFWSSEHHYTTQTS